MAHDRLAHDDSAAIFSPSVARIAASTARDWSYIDSWLISKFPGRPVPFFERNQDTLKTLLVLAAANEAADEERRLVAHAEADALQELRQRSELLHAQLGDGDGDGDGPRSPSLRLTFRADLLGAIQDSLPKEGTNALNSLASMAVFAGIAYPNAQCLGRIMLSFQSSVYQAEQAAARVDILNRHIQAETTRAQSLLRNLRADHYSPRTDLAKKNLDIQRRVKTMPAHLPDLQDRPTAPTPSAVAADMPGATVDQVARAEGDYLDILARRKELDVQMAAFRGLPSDPVVARSELDQRRLELQQFTSHRDEVFEGLVERESPAKRR